jgi:hypothetical protein
MVLFPFRHVETRIPYHVWLIVYQPVYLPNNAVPPWVVARFPLYSTCFHLFTRFTVSHPRPYCEYGRRVPDRFTQKLIRRLQRSKDPVNKPRLKGQLTVCTGIVVLP